MKKIISKIKNILIDNVWQVPQNLLGFLYLKSHDRDIVSTIDSNVWHCKIYLTKHVSNIAIGNKVFVYHRTSNLPIMVNHLIGHTLLSKKWGIIYLPVFGIPSYMWTKLCNVVIGNGMYLDFCSFYAEILADFEFAKYNHRVINTLQDQK